MIKDTLRRSFSQYFVLPVVTVMYRIGLKPNHVTFFGLAVTVVAACLISKNELWLGGVVLLLAGVFDLLDGALARLIGQPSRFGALFDSVVDRLCESVVLLGLLVKFAEEGSTIGIFLAYLAVVGSLMVSYLRARSEGLGIDCKIGVLARPERLILLSVGLVIGHWWEDILLIVLALIASLTMFTSLQRLLHARRRFELED